jgi:phosphopantothenoylcysteine decarboxylase/phosphopantothenate--cysteine ligase
MQLLENKRIVLGVTGGIAAYKSAELIRRLKDHGADIRVVMTDGAKAFITPLTMQAVSGNEVADSLLDEKAEAGMGHIALAKWADLVLIAPTTADVIAKISHGLANDLLSTICLATGAPIAIAPAMNQQMWAAKATRANMDILKHRDYLIGGPAAGHQACGDIGYGRMLEPNELVALVLNHFSSSQHLAGQHWLLTAGPTREAIDPVRYISNHSSGKMGYAIASAARQAGAEVTLISGPVNLAAPAGCKMIYVNSALEMHEQAISKAQAADVFIACAAVADYRIADIAEQKIKKSKETMALSLIKNPDIIGDVAKLDPAPFTVGFAAETQDVEKYALGKLNKKNLDMSAANNVAIEGQGFNSDSNALTLYWAEGKQELPLASKSQLAASLVKVISEHRK